MEFKNSNCIICTKFDKYFEAIFYVQLIPLEIFVLNNDIFTLCQPDISKINLMFICRNT